MEEETQMFREVSKLPKVTQHKDPQAAEPSG